jgi:hypothetical protein
MKKSVNVIELVSGSFFQLELTPTNEMTVEDYHFNITDGVLFERI